MPRFLAALIIFIAGWAPAAVLALSLGDIDLKSALNQPFVAEIPVSAETADELAALRVDMAASGTFQQYGLDRAAFLGDFDFEVIGQGASRVVRITSREAVVEPFVTLLLEIRWPQGRLLREYTVLLDPPVFAAEQVAPAVQAPAAGPVPTRVVRPATSPPESTVPAASQVAPAPTVPGIPAGSYGPVKRAETLWAIAGRYGPSAGVNRNQMMLAIYRVNPEAFIGNINRLKAGMILRIPDAEVLRQLSQREATAEVRRQNQAWRGGVVEDPGRLRLVPPPEVADDPDITPAVAPAGSGRTAAEVGTAQIIESLRKEVGQLEQELADSRGLIALRDRELQALQEQAATRAGQPEPAVIEPGVTEPAVDEPVAETPVVEPDEPAPSRPDVVVTTPAAEPPLMGGLFTNIWFYVALGGLLVLGLFIVRRRATEVDTPPWSKFEDEDESSARISGDAAAETTQQLSSHKPDGDDSFVVEESVASELTDEAQVPFRPDPESVVADFADDREEPETPLERTISTDSAVNLDETDPIAEADFHMAYGLYDQAADLLSNALNAEPENKDLRLKLIEVYFIWENQGGFLREAQALHSRLESPSDPDWNKILIMGKQICPDEDLFAASPASPGDAGDMDFALGEDLTSMQDDVIDFSFPEDDDEGLDFDLGGDSEEADSSLIDFNISTEDEAATLAAEDGMVEAATIESPIEPPTGDVTMESPTLESASLDATMESPIEPPTGEPTMETPTIESPSLDATMESPIEPPSGESTMETPTIESPLGDWGKEEADPEEVDAAGVDQTAEIDLDDLGLDLSGLADAAEGDALDQTGSPELHAETLRLDADSLEVFDDDTLSHQIAEGTFTGAGKSDGNDLDETLVAESNIDVTAEHPAFGDTVEQPSGGDTVEQPSIDGEEAEPPAVASTSSDDVEVVAEAAGTSAGIDFEIGETFADSDDTTSVVSTTDKIDDVTMTEAGTKLDLARAYIDMGDPDGARSILNEVLEEAGGDQRQEAQKLLDDLED